MKILKPISEDEMISVFLQGEINSNRFGKLILSKLNKDGKSREIINHPDLKDESENIYRKEIMQEYRGYGVNTHLFENFPRSVVWKKVILSKDELCETKYINYDYWIELSSGTRSPIEAAENIKKDLVVFGLSNENFLKAAEYVKNGGVFLPLIFVTKSEGDRLVNLEGHLRLTAYFLEPFYIPKELECIVGFSKDFDKWDLY